MKNKKSTELDVDFIGGAGSLTPAELETITQYLAEQKRKKQAPDLTKRTTTQRSKKIAAVI